MDKVNIINDERTLRNILRKISRYYFGPISQSTGSIGKLKNKLDILYKKVNSLSGGKKKKGKKKQKKSKKKKTRKKKSNSKKKTRKNK